MSEGAPEKVAGKFAGLFSRKVFGIPVSIFILIFVAGILWYALKMKPTETEEPVTDELGPEGDLMDEGSGVPIFIAHPPNGDTDDNPDIPDQPEQERTDQDWARDAIQWLIAGGAGTALATSAITRYLNDEKLSDAEGKLRDKALQQFGPPPSGYHQTGTRNNYNGPAVRQGNPPTSHIVKGKNDDTPQELARLYYGMETPEVVRYLMAQNTSLKVPYTRGVTVNIPKYKRPRFFEATQRVNTAAEIARRNGTTVAAIITLNPGKNFPVKPGTRVRIQ